MNANNPKKDSKSTFEDGSISRRNFVALAVSSLAVLPAVEEGFLIPRAPEKAFAEEVSSAPEAIEIVVVSPSEVGFNISDQTDNANAPIEGAHVVLTSRYNGKVLEDHSLQNGVVVFDVKELAEDNEDGVYAFDGTIDIDMPGYRTFHISLARIEGHTAFSVPTRQIKMQ